VPWPWCQFKSDRHKLRQTHAARRNKIKRHDKKTASTVSSSLFLREAQLEIHRWSWETNAQVGSSRARYEDVVGPHGRGARSSDNGSRFLGFRVTPLRLPSVDLALEQRNGRRIITFLWALETVLRELPGHSLQQSGKPAQFKSIIPIIKGKSDRRDCVVCTLSRSDASLSARQAVCKG
jgi:hypothetical protein